jgi:hypothetical protein
MVLCLLFIVLVKFPGPVKEQISGYSLPEKRISESSFPVPSQAQKDFNATDSRHLDSFSPAV